MASDEGPRHDGYGFRAVIGPPDGAKPVDVVIERTGAADENDRKAEWHPVQRWRAPAPDRKAWKAAVAESARDHGWILPAGTWPRRAGRPVVLRGLFPWKWELVVAGAAEERDRSLRAARDREEIWKAMIRTAHAKGVPQSALSAASGLSPARVQQIVGPTRAGRPDGQAGGS